MNTAEWFGIGLLGGSFAWLGGLVLLGRWADRVVLARYPRPED